jgi:flagellar motor component MotA
MKCFLEKFMVRYLVALFVLLAGIIAPAYLIDKINPMAFVDIPSFIISVIMPFLFVSIFFGFKKTSNAFSIPLKKEPEKDKLKPALNFFKMYGITTWVAGLVGIIIGLISMLLNFDDKNKVGPALAIILISLFYSAIINMLIIIPFRVFINKHIKEVSI